MRQAALAIALSAVALGASTAAAQQPTPAHDEARYRQTVREALEEFEAGNFQESLTLFQQAYAIHPTARVLRGIAKVRFELRQYVECVEAIDASLASTVDPLTPEMQAEMNELRGRAMGFVGTITVRVEPAGATVLLDGRELRPEQIGTPIAVPMGSHTIEASAPEHRDTHRTIDVQGGQTAEAALALEPIPVAPPPQQVIVQAPPPPPPPEEPSHAMLYAGIGLAGAGAVGLGVGIGLLVDRQSAIDYCDTSPIGSVCRNYGAIEGERNLAILPLAVGGAMVVTGVILIALDASSSGGGSSGEAQPAVACAPTADGFACAGGARW